MIHSQDFQNCKISETKLPYNLSFSVRIVLGKLQINVGKMASNCTKRFYKVVQRKL